jgi:hypothetical protein
MAQLARQIAGHRFHLFLPLAQIARRPIQLAQAVQNRALDAMLGISVKHHVLAAVVLDHGVEQAQHAGVNQIVQIHVDRQTFVNANGNRLHQREVVEHDLVALFVGDSRPLAYRHTCSSHRFVPLFLVFFLSRLVSAGTME